MADHSKPMSQWMQSLKRAFPNRKFGIDSSGVRKVMPLFRTWPEYKKSERVGKRVARSHNLLSFVDHLHKILHMPRGGVRRNVVLALTIAGFVEAIHQDDTGLWDALEAGEVNAYIDNELGFDSIARLVDYLNTHTTIISAQTR